MTSIFFPLTVATLFFFIVILETGERDRKIQVNNFGLLKWFSTGNWPAKVGALLLILGVGALLRYTLINLDFPPQLKLISGLVAVMLLAGASASLRNRSDRRAIHLALGGAAFGVAYLTAYSAYGFFNYITSVNALSLLAIVTLCTGYFAISSNAISLGILAMIGAYVAPAFALGNPDPVSVFGYYIAASIVSTVMVSMRGWRPLIHLSFLFSLAGAVFFGWNSKFYQPQFFGQILPMLLGLTLVHAFMPIVEQSHNRSKWLLRFDLGYFVLLPLVAGSLLLQIAPNVFTDGALGFCGLAVIWAVVALYLKLLGQNGVTRHVLVAVLLLGAALLCRLHSVPWGVLGLVAASLLLVAAPRLGWSKHAEENICAGILILALMHIAESTAMPVPLTAFFNGLFAQRLVAALAIGIAGLVARQRQIKIGNVLLIISAAWSFLLLSDEILRLHVPILPQLVYGLMLATVVTLAAIAARLQIQTPWIEIVACSFFIPGIWSCTTADSGVTLAYLFLTPLVLLFWTDRLSRCNAKPRQDNSIVTVLVVLPILLISWSMRTRIVLGIQSDLIFLVPIAVSLLVIAFWAPRVLSDKPSSVSTVRTFHFRSAALALTLLSMFRIERGIGPILLELLVLLFLAKSTVDSTRIAEKHFALRGAATVVCFALVLQASLLRLFGPDKPIMSISDLNQMSLPALVSLMWAIFGAALTWWAMRAKSRSIWSAGALLLVLAAIKLVLFDFGSLGQLGNILAMIAAGLVFMAVAWFAPMPPVGTTPDHRPDDSVRRDNPTGITAQAGLASQSAIGVNDRPDGSDGATREVHVKNTTPVRTTPPPRPATVNTVWVLWLALIAIGIFAYFVIESAMHHNPSINNTTPKATSQLRAPADPALGLQRFA